MSDLRTAAVIVTGAGQGLGRAYALALARAGARVVLNDIDRAAAEDTAAAIRRDDGSVVVHVGSVEEESTGPELVELALAHFGSLGAMVLNAGVMDVNLAVESAAAEIRRVVAVNLVGTMLCGTAGLRVMSERGAGRLVLITSGARFGMPGLSAYGATKSAVASLTWSWAQEAAVHGVRVNALSPIAQTAMFALNPLVSAGPAPERIAPAVVYLASPEHTLSGEIVRFDGTAVSLYVGQGGVLSRGITRAEWTPAEIGQAIDEIRSSR